MTSEQSQIRKGLVGVIADETRISKVNPETNSLLYRGYPVQELAEKCSVEQVALLLWNGELPSDDELAAFETEERRMRGLAANVRRVIDDISLDAHPMDVLRTAVSLIGAEGAASGSGSPDSASDDAEDARRSVALFAALPAIVAYDQRRRHGLDVIEPRDDLDYSANFLFMTFGEEAAPEVVDAFRVSMILYAEHSFNASTFTARVVASTLSDLYSAVVAAIGALKGPLHGGANEAVMEIVDEIGLGDGVEERVTAWLDEALAAKRKIMGFGHRVYKNGDSRVPTMRAALETLTEHYERPDVLDFYAALESGMGERKNIKPNLDYPSGPAYHLMGFDTRTFTPLFAAARVVGWTAHIREQLGSNALIRPLSEYTGPAERHL